jgi:hypothetical protein
VHCRSSAVIISDSVVVCAISPRPRSLRYYCETFVAVAVWHGKQSQCCGRTGQLQRCTARNFDTAKEPRRNSSDGKPKTQAATPLGMETQCARVPIEWYDGFVYKFVMLGGCETNTETIEIIIFTRIRTTQDPRLYEGRWFHVTDSCFHKGCRRKRRDTERKKERHGGRVVATWASVPISSQLATAATRDLSCVATAPTIWSFCCNFSYRTSLRKL